MGQGRLERVSTSASTRAAAPAPIGQRRRGLTRAPIQATAAEAETPAQR